MTAANLIQSRSDMYAPCVHSTFVAGVARDLTGADAPVNAQHLPCHVAVQGPGNFVFVDINGTTNTIAMPAGTTRMPIGPAELTAANACSVTVFWVPRVNAKRPFFPTQVSTVSAWLRLAGATVTGSGYSSVPDLLNSNPAVQGTDANRPVNGTSANGLPIATFATSFLQWPLVTANNGATKMGFAGWFKLANVVGNKTLAVITLTAGGASANKVLYMVNGNQLRADDQTVDRHAVSTNTVDTAWHFLTEEIDCTPGPEAAKVIQSIDGVVSVTGFSSDTAWSATLGTPTGNMLIGATTLGAASPFVGTMGPNLFFLNGQLTVAERAALMNFEVPT